MKKIFSKSNIEVYQSEIYATNTTIFKGENGVVIVDPNWLPSEIDFLEERFSNYSQNRESAILYTHSDYDHILSFGKISGDYYIGSKLLSDRKNKEKEIAKILKWDADLYLQRNYEPQYPIITNSIVADGQKIEIGDLELMFWMTPGHVEDALVCFEVQSKTLIVGDYLSNLEFPFVEWSFIEYQKTLEKLSKLIVELKPLVIIPGHGQPMVTIPQTLGRIQNDLQYLKYLEEEEDSMIMFDHINKYVFGHGLLSEHKANIARMKKPNNR